MLEGKVAVIYGAGGAIGGAVAREGARLFLTGRNPSTFEALAKETNAAAAEVDATDERAVEDHLSTLDRVDISFNAIGLSDPTLLGTPLTDLDLATFTQPITTWVSSYFLTARLAARRMLEHKQGVLMTVTTLHSRTGLPLVGGYGPAMAAKEALTRELSAELAPHGIRAVGLRPNAIPEAATTRAAFIPRAKAMGMSWEQFQEVLASRTHPKRLTTLAEVGDTAAFLASDRASGMTGTTVNLTMGCLDD
ncbi:SDR family oxidoreductase [Tenggerimyces flavus]|uniref:SDR family oxidoreductase n=1 Tax=Tenggerimyces flavus TaxID=1708749 RepID=A0ABV7Y7E9_9ACTN|nr:SDR family oxidoreductase [Tenggerimyces flavus]MBM7788394.1 NAD(P)-dependent dehydrogenase (short-subunit alcohol dehydrogenase family) [Tenggerimyces flavus]